jgi:hypothetical protein
MVFIIAESSKLKGKRNKEKEQGEMDMGIRLNGL